MSIQKSNITSYLRKIPHFFRYGLLVLLVLFLSLFFPVNVEKNQSFELGENWKYDDLRAPFSFPIQKTESELEQEKKILSRDFLPYYRLNKNILNSQKESLASNLSKYLQSNKNSISTYPDSLTLVQLGNNILERLYKKHIIRVEPQHENRNNIASFKLIENQIDLGEFNSNDFYDVKRAAQFVVDTLEKLKMSIPKSNILLGIMDELVQVPDIYFDADLSKKNKELALKNLSPVRDKVKAGELIIRKGELIDSTTYSKILSYRIKYEQEINKHKNSFLIYTGYLSITLALLLILGIYLYIYARNIYDNLQHTILIYALIGIFAYISFSVEKLSAFSLYFVPFCIVPIIVKNFFSAQIAIFTHLVMILIISLILTLNYDFMIVQLLAGMVAVMSRRKIRYMTDFFVSVFYIGMAYVVSFLCTELLRKGILFPVTLDNDRVVEQGIEWAVMGWLVLNILLTLLSYPFIPLLEKAFGLISEITLIELSDLNKALLRELSFKAPGTMQHSLQVSNLSEAAANAIGANALLVKVAALYHDIGKMQNSHFFIENQQQNNPHLQLSYQESAKMIISHVHDGVKLAKKYNLPNILIDFIRTHHGTTRVEYFYRMQKNEKIETEINESEFTYPGPKPRNREEVILMISDSVEAASKSLKNPSGKDIDNLVDNIINFKISHGQLQESNISFSELDIVKSVLKKMLRSMYHVRIEYPEEKLPFPEIDRI
jgi:cyclic-di-AMP phosphodiesterase PgpH